MSAILHGVGVGPGAPDLLTLRAVVVLRGVDVVAAPRPSDDADSLAWRIARDVVGEVPGQERLLLTFPMTRDAAARAAARDAAVAAIAARLAAGRSVAFVTEGDPLLYSTFLDLLAAAPRAGARAEVVPGISSITAVGAAARVALADGDDAIAVLPAARALRDLPRLAHEFETLLLLKAGRHLAALADALDALGLAAHAWAVSDASRPGERVTPIADAPGAPAGYFTTVIVRTRGEGTPPFRGLGRPLPAGEAVGGPTPPWTRGTAVYAVTAGGARLGRRLADALGAELLVAERFAAAVGARPFALPMRDAVAASFRRHERHVFVLAVGATVRLVAPLLADKRTDPAVVCVDEAGRFAVALVGGHVGGANALADEVACAIGATPVITTASDVTGTLAVDLLGHALGFVLEDPHGNATRAAAAVVNGEPVALVQEAGSRAWWPEGAALPPNLTPFASTADVVPSRFPAALVISDRDVPEALLARAVVYRPQTLAVGIGCDRGAPASAVTGALDAVLAASGLARASIAALASIDVKRDEAGLLEAAAGLRRPLHLYPAAALDAVPGIERPSEAVQRCVGTRGVSEPAALLAAGAAQLLVPKQLHRDPASGKAVTVAVARIPEEKT